MVGCVRCHLQLREDEDREGSMDSGNMKDPGDCDKDSVPGVMGREPDHGGAVVFGQLV